MSYPLSRRRNAALTEAEWSELLALKAAISEHVSSVHPDHLERFAELFARTLLGKGDDPTPCAPHCSLAAR